MKILDDYRYKIVSNRKDIDIYKNSIDNSSTDVEDNSSGHNSKIAYNKINNSNREVKVVRYNSNGSCYKYEINNKNRYVSVREYNINRVYNYERGATTDDPWLVDGEVNPPLMLQQKQLLVSRILLVPRNMLVPRKMLMLQHKKFRLTKKIGKLPFQLWVLVNV